MGFMGKHPSRYILHVDMDAFYASVEQVDRPVLKGRPVIVGGGKRGVVSSASYEARRYGVRSAMPMFHALKRCPQAVVLPVRMERYQEVSHRVMALLKTFSPLVEPVSIDEAFVDHTGTERIHGHVLDAARRIKKSIVEETGVTCSVGIGPNKLLAKIASDQEKPDGLTFIPSEAVSEFMQGFPVAKIPGIGPKMVSRLQRLGVRTCGDVLRHPLEFWCRRLGSRSGKWLVDRAAGVDPSPVVPERERKSVGAENTFERDIQDRRELLQWIGLQSERVGRRLRHLGLCGKTVTLKVKFADFRQISRSRTLAVPTNVTEVIFHQARKLLDDVPLERKVRLTGVVVSRLCHGPVQPLLFPDKNEERWKRLDEALDWIADRYGREMVRKGLLLRDRIKKERGDRR